MRWKVYSSNNLMNEPDDKQATKESSPNISPLKPILKQQFWNQRAAKAFVCIWNNIKLFQKLQQKVKLG